MTRALRSNRPKSSKKKTLPQTRRTASYRETERRFSVSSPFCKAYRPPHRTPQPGPPQPPRTGVTAGTGRWPRGSACLTAPPTPPPQRRRVGTHLRLRGARLPLSLPAAEGPAAPAPAVPMATVRTMAAGPRAKCGPPGSAPGPGRTLTHLQPRETAAPVPVPLPAARSTSAAPVGVEVRGARARQGACAGVCSRLRSAVEAGAAAATAAALWNCHGGGSRCLSGPTSPHARATDREGSCCSVGP